MKSKIIFYVSAVLLCFFYLRGFEANPTEKLPESTGCGIYGEKLEPYLTGMFDENGGTLEGFVKENKVHVTVKRVYTKMCRDNGKFPRYMVEVKFNDRVMFTVSHTDIPFAINTYYRNTKYRLICVDAL